MLKILNNRIITLKLSYFAVFFISGIHSTYAQFEKNVRSSYEEIHKLIPHSVAQHPNQSVLFKNSELIIAPLQDSLIRLNKVKSKKEIYDEDGWLISYFDLTGKKTHEENLFYGSMTNRKYDYDDKGRLIKMTSTSENGSFSKEYAYDDKDRILVIAFTNSEGEVKYTNFYYNDALKTYLEANEDGIEKYFLNSIGERVYLESFESNYKVMGWAKSTYDARGLKSKEEAKMMGITIEDSFIYNKKGQLLKASRTGLVNATWEYIYNENGLVTFYENKNPSFNSTEKYEYTYYE